MKYLLDTCTLSEFVKKAPNSYLISWLDDQDETHLYLSVITIGELYKGIHKLHDINKKKRLQSWIENSLLIRFADRILETDTDIVTIWGEILGKAEKKGETLPSVDALIAATAIFYNLIIVTRNTKDLDRCGATTLNPYS